MLKNITVFLLVIHSVLHAPNASLVPFIKPCKVNDNDCLLAANMQIAIPYLADGIPELEIPAAEPMFFENITMDQGYVKFNLPYLKVVGAKKCRLVHFMYKHHASTMKLTLDCPILGTGTYKFSGKICIFNIEKEGDFKIKTEAMRTNITTKTDVIRGKDGKKYWNLLSFEYSYQPLGSMEVDLVGLFAGDIAKAQPFMSVINKEWGTDVLQVGQPIADCIVRHFYEVLKTFFHRIPIDQFTNV